MKLSDPKVKKAKPEAKPYKLADGGGMYLEVMPNGSKYWRLKYRFGGKEKKLALGVYPAVTLAHARIRRDDARKLLANGIDPSEIKQAQKKQNKIAIENSFEAIAREWHTLNTPRWTANHAYDVLHSLEKEVFPAFGDAPISSIDAPTVLDAIRKIEGRKALDVAGRVLQRVRVVFAYAIASGRARHNPAAEIMGALAPRPKKKHYPAIKPHEMPTLLHALADYWERDKASTLARIATRLLSLTFVRTGELRGARWNEFDFEKMLWTIPAERMKAREPHTVPLSRQALAALNEIHPLTGHGALLFPSRSGEGKAMSDNTINMVLKRSGYAGKMCGHGFRSVASTYLNELGTIRPDIIEAQLAHADKNAVRAAYNRADYMEYRKAMMQFWADTLDKMQQGGKLPKWVEYEPRTEGYRASQIIALRA
ncbi:MAG: integrase arm-type DNA-binding domain-containing protein [Nitrosomonadales bacterium]|nr:integrase arm-type DNA-binding domain-containing protein [Nitrosomonadales bacterium]